MLFSAFDDTADPTAVDASFDAAAREQLPAIVVFPGIRSEEQLLAQLKVLTVGDRWKVSRERVKSLETDDLLIGVRWTTAQGLASTPMGFAPFPTMPVTRRAPYVCLATWPGAHENPHRRPRDPDAVDFLDAAFAASLTKDEYQTLWKASVDRTTALLAETADQARFYRSVTYRLGPSLSASVWP